MSDGLILAGEPMGLLIAQNEGPLDSVSGYSLAVAGAEFNVAVGTARLHHHVTYMTKLGNDPFGKRIIRVLNENKIGDEFVSFSDTHKTGFMLKGRISNGDPDIFYFRAGSAASTLSPADVEKIDMRSYSYIHLTGILPALSEDTRKAVNMMFDKARDAGLTISFDPNLRPQLWPSEKIMRETINNLASRADIVLPGTAEGKILMGSDDPKKINDFYRRNGAKIVVTKCGASGAFVTDGSEEYTVEGYKVDRVIDTVGAGDGFAVGIITGLMENLSLRDAVKRGNAIGAIQVTSRGDNEGLPSPDELASFMAQK
ncbi:sugar kinase [Pectinatus haikarae]|uniref:2-dehydro-3-deoxygluconokinase n=1 Tax=Pectinatus haikarae TaxID=349096 RepID=A0ABT9YA17_9FIRM|nr:sugar kinase [Pectinatus haikarae]MDQ0204042.1 2-dehydro-3-deoxygluconokinase [Pectinatus haikarae]